MFEFWQIFLTTAFSRFFFSFSGSRFGFRVGSPPLLWSSWGQNIRVGSTISCQKFLSYLLSWARLWNSRWVKTQGYLLLVVVKYCHWYFCVTISSHKEQQVEGDDVRGGLMGGCIGSAALAQVPSTCLGEQYYLWFFIIIIF